MIYDSPRGIVDLYFMHDRLSISFSSCTIGNLLRSRVDRGDSENEGSCCGGADMARNDSKLASLLVRSIRLLFRSQATACRKHYIWDE